MRKIFTLIASVMAVAASAQVNVNMMEETISNETPMLTEIAQPGKMYLMKQTPTVVSGKRKAVVTAASVVGSYVTDEIATNLSSSGYRYGYSSQMTISLKEKTDASEPDTLIIIGLAGSSDTYPLKATINEAGKLSIEADQQVGTHTKYGKVTLRSYVINAAGKGIEISTDPITFSIYPGAGLLLNQYAMARAIPEYDTGTYNLTPYYYGTIAWVPNAKYSQKTAASKTAAALAAPLDYNVNAYVRQTANKDSVYVVGLGRVSKGYITIDSDKKAIMPNDQEMYFYSTTYTTAKPYPCNVDYETPNVTFYSSKSTEGTVDGGTISLAPWGWYMQNKSTNGFANVNGYNLETKITLNSGEFVLPEPVATAISTVSADKAQTGVRKMLKNGQLIIVNGANEYNVAGARVK